MSLFVVPTFSDPTYHQATTFEGTLYNLEFDYNQRGACWYMNIADVDGVDIYNGIKLVTGFDLFKKCKDPRRPPGGLFVVSNTNDLTPPGPVDLLPGSGRCKLMYLSSDWMAIIQAGNLAAITALFMQLVAGSASTISPISTYGQQ